ncbi:unnamed protein product [Dovyalis caffra]|uniref:Uncharacterized protein n=1 Tax=Dovyalis caffra TaxID=77055 RepID=A0AAV1QNW1_9ROSI|nr:unnamed protein product [Dovyalis caffra]
MTSILEVIVEFLRLGRLGKAISDFFISILWSGLGGGSLVTMEVLAKRDKVGVSGCWRLVMSSGNGGKDIGGDIEATWLWVTRGLRRRASSFSGVKEAAVVREAGVWLAHKSTHKVFDESFL